MKRLALIVVAGKTDSVGNQPPDQNPQVDRDPTANRGPERDASAQSEKTPAT